uniref:Uncharacterized protein n=2 Tax=viral metagenome TaxID=1070528 RepID=A0A6M3L1Q2_9ZZZZ
MKLEMIIGFLCVTIIVVAGMALGYDGVLAASALSLIGGLLGWQGKKVLDKRGGNTEATTASLKKAGFSDDMIAGIIDTIKRRK